MGTVPGIVLLLDDRFEKFGVRKPLINQASRMKRKADGAQETRHIIRIGEFTSTAQRSDSPAQAINQTFPRRFACFAVAYLSFLL